MVVACGTHLMKTSKNVALSKKIKLSTSSLPFTYRNYFNCTRNVPSVISKNETLVRLCCACRRFHSTDYFQTSRESRTALTPQEILLVNCHLVYSLAISEPLDRVQRAILSESPILQLNNILNQDLSRSSVQSYAKAFLPESLQNLVRSLASEDPLPGLVNRYAEDPRIIRAASNSDVQGVLDVLNQELGGPILVISNETVTVDVDAVASLLEKAATAYIQQLYPGNFYAQLAAGSFAQEQIRIATENLRTVLANTGIPVEAVRQLLAVIGNPSRAKRDIVTDFMLNLLRPQIAAILTPIQAQVDAVFDNLIAVVLSLYTPTLPTSPILAIVTNITNVVVVRVAEILVVVQTNVDSIFTNLINGTTTVASRRRRDLGMEFEELYGRAVELSHRRVARSLDIFGLITDSVSGIYSILILPFTSFLNGTIKNIVITIFASLYCQIGEIITIPIRVLVNNLIDSLFPCDTCSSIV